MVSQKMYTKKVIFWIEKNVTCDTSFFQNLHISVLFNKTKNMQSSKLRTMATNIEQHISCYITLSKLRAYFRFY